MAFEGLDQSGKKTLSTLLAERLRERGLPVELISFPDYSTPIGEEIRLFLSGERDYPPEVRYLLFAANRWENKGKIESWLKEGQVVIANRYSASGVAYGMAHGLDEGWLWGLERGLPEPAQAFLFDIAPQVSFSRKAEGRDLYERQVDLLKRVREAYLSLASRGGWMVLDGSKGVESILRELLTETLSLLKEREDKPRKKP